MAIDRRAFLEAIAFAAASPLGATAAGVDAGVSAVRIQRLAWAGIKIVCADATLFVDASQDPSAPGPQVASETRERHALITHHHGDHFDATALRAVLGNSGILVVPEGVAPWADTRAFRVQTAKLYEPVMLPRGTAAFCAIAVPAVDGLGHPQVSWVIDAGGKRIFHGGDTSWHGYWWDIARAYGPFDAAFLPINGFRQVQGRYTDSGVPMSLTPEQAAAAAELLHARLALAIHYGNAGDGYLEVPDAPRRFLAASKARGVNARLMAAGDWIDL
jgi:L-ascorbate metabolism protein UlaG (beta-lactamase superfamily)